ncbi:hypothetical protein Emed_002839 [Eimeria media]
MRMTWWSAALWLTFAYSTAFCSAAINISGSVQPADTKGTVEERGRTSNEAATPSQAAGATLRVHSHSSSSRNAPEMKHGHLAKHAQGALVGEASAPPARLDVTDAPSEPTSHLTNAALPAHAELDGFEETNQGDSEPQGETYDSAGAPPASLESFNSLYNLPPGFIERKTPREIEYERRVMSRLLSRGDAPPSPRTQGRHLAPNADAAGFDRSASR